MVQNRTLKLLYVITVCFAYAFSLSVGVYRSFYKIAQIIVVRPIIHLNEDSSQYFLQSLLFSCGLIVIAVLADRLAPFKNSASSYKEKIIALSPLLLFGLEAIFPISFYTPVVFIWITGIVFFRLISTLNINLTAEEKSRKSKFLFPGMLLLFFAVFTFWSVYLQHEAWKSFHLLWADWGIFVDMVKHAYVGQFGYSTIHGYNHLGIHFSPALIILMPLLLFKNVHIIFLFSSILIYCAGITIYYYARYLKMSKSMALILSLIVFFTPGLSQLSLSIYYGFRENYMAFASIFLTAFFWEKRKYWPMLIFLIFSMMIKESVLIFLATMGAILIIQKKYRSGSILFVSSSIIFLLVFFVFFPWMRNGESYSQLIRYDGLGKNLTEILLASVQKPALFWGYFIRPCVIGYLLTLFVPFFILIGIRPLVCFSAAVVLFFTCLQSYDWFITIAVWYQTLPLIAIYLCILWNCRDVKKEDRNWKWFKWLQYGLENRNNSNMLSSALVSCLICVVLSCFFWGQVPFGKIAYPKFRGDHRKAVAKLKTFIPKNSKLTVDNRIATHFMFYNVSFSRDEKNLGNYVLFDMLNPFEGERYKNIELRDQLIKSKEFIPIAISKSPHSLLILFSRDKNTKKMPLPRLYSAKEVGWEKLKMALPIDDKNFELRCKFIKHNNQIRVIFFIMLKQKINYDTKFSISLSDGKRNRYWTFFAGNGLLPTWSWKTGQVFCFGSILPDNLAPRFGKCTTEKQKKKKITDKPELPSIFK